MIQRVETLFKALGEPTRLKIVKLLSIQELCVCELEAVLEISQPRVSQHLKVLKRAGIIRERKERQRSFFSLDGRIKAGRLAAFTSYMTADLKDLEGFTGEAGRLAELERNEAVMQCKSSPRQPRLISGIT